MKSELFFNPVPVCRNWIKCKYCGKNLVIADNTAKCKGVYIKCQKCKKENEIIIN